LGFEGGGHLIYTRVSSLFNLNIAPIILNIQILFPKMDSKLGAEIALLVKKGESNALDAAQKSISFSRLVPGQSAFEEEMVCPWDPDNSHVVNPAEQFSC